MGFFEPLFRASFWFARIPAPLSPFFVKALFAFFGIILILGAVVRIVASNRKHDRLVKSIFDRVGSCLVSMGFLGVLLYFFSYQRIPFLGMRFWFLVWGVIFVAWLGWIVYYALKVVPKQRECLLNRLEQMKYMPIGKKKKNKKRR
ncbi:MAG: hypothetical protein ABIG32_02165 [Candidatus Uhrbacteria bacterium]|nr:hypothetical protein [Patescibacteria group bacterium]MBU1907251.1 hypothetical protein [Patescibacteria group bacterium]